MSSRFKNIYLIVLLAFLQCFAPLLHAHALDTSHADGVHFHFDHDMSEHDGAETGKPALKIAHTEFPVIGMAQEYKQDYVVFVADDHAALPPGFPVPFLNAPTLAVTAQPHLLPFRFHRPLPFSQAPPASLF